MNSHSLKFILLYLCVCFSVRVTAQTEFPNEGIVHLRWTAGLVSTPSSPEYFVGTLQVVPQYTIIPHRLRGGAVAGATYSSRKVHALFGPTISYKLTEFKAGYFGSAGNVHLSAEHLWGTGHQRLIGGGVHLDLLNRIVIGLSAHRDYHFSNWWWQSVFALRISRVQKTQESFPN